MNIITDRISQKNNKSLNLYDNNNKKDYSLNKYSDAYFNINNNNKYNILYNKSFHFTTNKFLETESNNIQLPKSLSHDNNYINFKINNIIKHNSLGRKSKNSQNTGSHDKYSQDNILRKIKCNILLNLFKYINNQIHKMYEGKIKNGLPEKNLKILSKKKIFSNSKNNKAFLNKTLKDIFSENISSIYKFYRIDHNKKVINDLLNEKTGEIRQKFNKLFSLTFLEVLFHIRGEKYFEELEGLEQLDFLCEKYNDDKDYEDLFRYYVLKYEKIIMNKRSRQRKKSLKKY